MVLLPSYDERTADCTGQAARGQSGWGQENLATADGEVCTKVDREGGEAACGTEAVLASCPVTRSTHFSIRCHQVSPTLTGLTPGCLSSAISQTLIITH